MKRFFLIILTAASMLACCSCAGSSVLEKTPESNTDQAENNRKAAAAEAWEVCDKSEMQTFTGEDRGIAFTVYTDKREYAPGETVRVKAEVQNVSNGELYNFHNSEVECYPIEILLDISCGGKDIYYREGNTGETQSWVVYVPMEPGIVYDDYISFKASYYSAPAEPGEYKGRCYIYTVSVPDYHAEFPKMHSVDFSITLIGNKIYPEPKESDAEIWEKCDKSEMQTFTGEDGGIVFTVYTDKREYTIGETIKVKAIVRNNTDSDIYYPPGGELLSCLNDPRNGKTLYTGWLDGYVVLACGYFELSPGEVDKEYYIFETRYYKGGTAEPGEYNGICTFTSIENGEEINHSVDFSIEIKPQTD